MQVKEKDRLSVCGMDKSERGKSVSHNSTGKTSFFKTTFNAVNTLAGVRIMSIPYAISSGGWLSLLLLFVIASATFYTGLLIKRCMDVDPSVRSYTDIGDKAFGTKGRILISVSIHLELFLIAVGFLILAGDNLHKLLPNMEKDMDGVQIGGHRSFNTACSLYTMCYHAHSVFPTLYTSSRNHGQFHLVLLVGFLFSTTTYVSMAIMGYQMFGSEVQSQITLSLPTKSFSSKVAIFTAFNQSYSQISIVVEANS